MQIDEGPPLPTFKGDSERVQLGEVFHAAAIRVDWLSLGTSIDAVR